MTGGLPFFQIGQLFPTTATAGFSDGSQPMRRTGCVTACRSGGVSPSASGWVCVAFVWRGGLRCQGGCLGCFGRGCGSAADLEGFVDRRHRAFSRSRARAAAVSLRPSPRPSCGGSWMPMGRTSPALPGARVSGGRPAATAIAGGRWRPAQRHGRCRPRTGRRPRPAIPASGATRPSSAKRKGPASAARRAAASRTRGGPIDHDRQSRPHHLDGRHRGGLTVRWSSGVSANLDPANTPAGRQPGRAAALRRRPLPIRTSSSLQA